MTMRIANLTLANRMDNYTLTLDATLQQAHLYAGDRLQCDLFLDTIDAMTFGFTHPFQKVTEFAALRSYLQQEIGGKILLLLPSHYSLYREAATDFFNRIMYLQNPILFAQRISRLPHATPYRILTHKSDLLTQTTEIADLLINHAEWAGKWDHKRRLYGPAAITARLDNPRISAIAIMDNEQVIGFARVYIVDNYFGYFSDIVIHENYRGQGLMTLLMAYIRHQTTRYCADSLLLIAGTPQLIATYQRFGFASAQNTQPLKIKDKILIGCAGPPGHVLTAYQQQFTIPICPKKYRT